jgi:TonB-linked SusC/RagA family outer membrane protein
MNESTTENIIFMLRKLTSAGIIILIVMLGIHTGARAQTNESNQQAASGKKDNDAKITVAYGERTAVSLTGAQSTVTSEKLSKAPVSTLGNAIQGWAGGLTVLRTVGAEPGWDQPQFFIRGVQTFGGGTTPLVMVDHVERDFSQLDPEEVASITVLKDAAATALYGMRGANGVILVTTKRGFVGKPVITLTAQYGTQSATRLPQYLGSPEHVGYRNLALRNDFYRLSDTEFNDLFLSNPQNNPASYDGSNPFLYANTNWHDEFLKSSAPQQSYKLSFRGGTETARYYLMMGIMDQEGLYKYTDENDGYSTQNKFNRYNFRSTVDVDLSEYLTVGINLGGRVENRHTPSTGAGTIMSALSKISPTVPVFNTDSSIAGSSVYNYNPYGMIAKTGFADRFSRYLQGTVTAGLKLDQLVKGLSANGMFGFDAVKLYGRSKGQKYAVFQQNADNTYSQFGESTSIDLNYSGWGSEFNLMLNYKFGLQYSRKLGADLLEAEINYMQSSLSTDGDNPDYRNQGIFGRTTYTYANKIAAEFGFAYNGSENFSQGSRFGFFPTGSLAWTLSNEDFLRDNTTLSLLKIRASYGKVGNSNIGIGYRYPFEEKFYSGGGYYFGTAGTDGATEGRIPNPNIFWEESLNANFGIELGLWKNTYVELDLFNHNRNNIITGMWNTHPSLVGQDLPYVNSGSVTTKGFELAISHEGKMGELKYNAGGIMSFARNTITGIEEVAGMNAWEYRQGRVVNQQWGLQVSDDLFFNNQAEIDNWAQSTFGSVQPGDIKYIDQNNDKIIDSQDMVPLGKPSVPEWNYGINLGLSYRGIDFNVLLTGIANRSLFMTNNVFRGMQDNNKITQEVAENSWGVSNNPVYPRLSTLANPHNYQPSSLWLKDLGYLRVQTIELGYNLPAEILRKLNIGDVRFFVNAYNLFSFDGMSKYNVSAEIPNAGVTLYPETRVINVGTKLRF